MNVVPIVLALLALLPASLQAQSTAGGWECPAPAGPAPSGDDGSAAVIKDNRWIYVVDHSGFFAYDLKASPPFWSRKADFPGAPTEGCAAAVSSGKVWVAAGSHDLTLYCYDPGTETWGVGPALPASAMNNAMASNGTTLYLLVSSSWRAVGSVDGTFFALDTTAAAPAWQVLPELPFSFGMIGATATFVGADLYATGGGDYARIYKYSQGAWNDITTSMPTPPKSTPPPPNIPPQYVSGREMGLNSALVTDGTSLLCHPGTPFMAFRGPELEAVGLWRRNADLKTWEKISDFPGSDKPAGYGFPCGTNTVVATDTKKLYYYRSGGTSDLWSLDLATATWSLASTKPAPLSVPLVSEAGVTKIVGRGGSTVAVGRKLYAMTGNNMPDFFSLDTSATTPAWTRMASLPAAIGGRSTYQGLWNGTMTTLSNEDGGSLVYDGARYLYAVGSGAQAWRFDTSIPAPGAWTSIASLPSQIMIATHAKLVHVPADITLNQPETLYLFGLTASSMTLKWIVGAGTWTVVSDAPDSFGPGLAAVYPGRGRLIYVLRGSSSTFWTYDVSTDGWSKPRSGGFDPADLPGSIGSGPGASLCYVGGKMIYALTGFGWSEADGRPGNELWAYQLPDTGGAENTWIRLGAGAFTVSDGGSLAYPARGAYLYATIGNNTGIVARYEIPNEAPVAFDARQLKGDGTPIPAGGSSFDGGWTVSMSGSDNDADMIYAEVQYRLLGETAYRLVTSADAAPGSTVKLFVPVSAPGQYEWRARLSDVRGGASSWTEFGGGAGSADVRVRSENLLPTAAVYLIDGATGGVVAPGSQFPYGHFDIKVRATLDDPDALGDRGRLEMRVRSTAGAIVGEDSGNLTAPGAVTAATCTIEAEGSYTIETRYVDEFGLAGAWTRIGSGSFDVHIPRNGSTGPANCGQSAGVMLALPALLAALGLSLGRGNLR